VHTLCVVSDANAHACRDFSTEIVDDNNEFYHLKEAVLQDGSVKRKDVDIVELTKHTLDVTTDTVSRMMERAVDKKVCAAYAVCTGMQIHEESGVNHIHLHTLYVVKDGKKEHISLV